MRVRSSRLTWARSSGPPRCADGPARSRPLQLSLQQPLPDPQRLARCTSRQLGSADNSCRQLEAGQPLLTELQHLLLDIGSRKVVTCEALAAAPAAAVERIGAPVLLVTGDEDIVAPPQSVRAMAERLTAAKGVRTVVLNRCGHWTPVERADDCVRELRAFLPAQR